MNRPCLSLSFFRWLQQPIAADRTPDFDGSLDLKVCYICEQKDKINLFSVHNFANLSF